jgi:DNA-binding NtrC family response regulator
MTRILIVDDEVAILNALGRLLRRTPCVSGDEIFRLTVDSFASPRQALEKAACTAYDLVLCDYRMPGINGVEWLKALRRLQPDTARLIMSGHADLAALVGAINEAGISRFIAKPWNDADLVATLGEVLAQRKQLLENQRLADEARLADGTISAQEAERRRLEALEPGITRVIWGPDGSVLLDESLLDETDPARRRS